VRPFVRICADAEQPPLRQFECLLALTNLASIPDAGQIGQRIVSCKGVETAHTLQFSDIPLVRRAATELVCNLMMFPAAAERYMASSERIKLLVALTDVDDEATCSAAAGALAILASMPEGARKILDSKRGLSRMLELLEDKSYGMRHRGAECLRNIVALDKAAAVRVAEAGGVARLMTAMQTSKDEAVRYCVAETLRTLHRHGLVSQ
jgi:hypothetical protein